MPTNAPYVRGALINEDTQVAQAFMFNPTQLTAQITVNWNKGNALGASYERLSYSHTSNVEFNLTLKHHLDAWIDRTKRPGEQLNEAAMVELRRQFEDHRRFLMAFAYPRGRYTDVLRRSPPTAMLMWPGYLAIRVVLNSLQFTDTRFDEYSRPIEFDAACVFQEQRTYRLTSADAMSKGFLRTDVLDAEVVQVS